MLLRLIGFSAPTSIDDHVVVEEPILGNQVDIRPTPLDPMFIEAKAKHILDCFVMIGGLHLKANDETLFIILEMRPSPTFHAS